MVEAHRAGLPMCSEKRRYRGTKGLKQVCFDPITKHFVHIE